MSMYTTQKQLLGEMTKTNSSLEELIETANKTIKANETYIATQRGEFAKFLEDLKKERADEREAYQKAIADITSDSRRYYANKEQQDDVSTRFGLTNSLIVIVGGGLAAFLTGSLLTTGVAVVSIGGVILGVQTATGKVFYKQISKCWNKCCGSACCTCSTCCKDKSTVYKNDHSNCNSKSSTPKNGAVGNNTAAVTIDIDSKEDTKKTASLPTTTSLPNMVTTSTGTGASAAIPIAEAQPAPNSEINVKVDVKTAFDTPPEASTTQTSSVLSASSPTHHNKTDSPHPKGSPVLTPSGVSTAVVSAGSVQTNTYLPSKSGNAASSSIASRTKTLTAAAQTTGHAITPRAKTPSRTARSRK